jgi:hypothetical protein
VADDLISVEDVPFRISHKLTPAEGSDTFTVTSATVSIFNSAGTELVAATAASAESPGFGVSTAALVVYYDYTPTDPGDFSYVLLPLIGGARITLRGRFTVWPKFSLLDRYIGRIQGWLQETEIGEAQQDLSLRDYRDALAVAVRAFSEVRPRELRKDVSLTANDWTYALSGLATGITPTAEWAEGVSRILEVEEPYDATLQSRSILGPLDFEVDERAAEWRLKYVSPSAGQTARVTWTALHTLSHTVDTLPADAFELLTQYAAGVALQGPLANLATRTNDPQIAADVVSFRDRQQRSRQQGMEMQAAAKRLWRRRQISI